MLGLMSGSRVMKPMLKQAIMLAWCYGLIRGRTAAILFRRFRLRSS